MIVVSDRRVIDGQLQKAIFDFERTKGVVETIKNEGDAKGDQLAKALAGGKKVIVCTIQSFPTALKKVRELAATEGKRFAVIADEAHSSQTGEAAAKLKEVLSPEELAQLADGGEVDVEDLLAAQMAARASETGITYVAFTATPKAKTLQLFGRSPGPDGLPAPFHVYSMRQAIEEGFILDVLKNYTPYKMAFKLAHEGQELDEVAVERSAAMKGIMRWVRLHPYNIAQKVQIVVEHFRERASHVTRGRVEKLKEAEGGWSFGFSLEQVPLGIDNDGDPITSAVTVFQDAPGSSRATKQRPLTPFSQILLNALISLVAEGEADPVASLPGRAPLRRC